MIQHTSEEIVTEKVILILKQKKHVSAKDVSAWWKSNLKETNHDLWKFLDPRGPVPSGSNLNTRYDFQLQKWVTPK